MKFGDIIISVVLLLVIMLIIIPMTPVFLDLALVVNITISLTILILTLYIKEPLQFSVFPSLLLIVTIFRLALNISSTRLILGNNGEAGSVIKTFGSFVIGDNLAVGLIIFIIIIVIQFLVITKGAERVSEVAARFTLDAMPGKQMAIDADLNSGLIDEEQARNRRIKVQREADFYGAMDGAGKFVKGDAIVAIIITVINIVGGMIIGSISGNMPISEVISIYTLATVGDGLVSQIPALMVSTATGIIVTRAASENNMSFDLTKQLFSQPIVLFIVSGALVALSLIPGMPRISMLGLSALMGFLGYSLYKSGIKRKAEEQESEDIASEHEQNLMKPENVISLLELDPIEIELGYGLISLADVSQGGDLLNRVIMIRRQFALDLGIIIPVIRIRDNIQISTNEYIIKIKGFEVANGEVMAEHYLAMNPGDAKGSIEGIETKEPTFGLPAMWITDSEREKAELLGYTLIDPTSVIATHLTEVLRAHSSELLDRQQVLNLIDNLKLSQPALVDEVIPKMFSLGDVHKILANLLKEGISIRDITTIIETISDYGGRTKDTELLTEYIRQNLKRGITQKYSSDNTIRVITLDPKLEQAILENVRRTDNGSYVALDPDMIQNIYISLNNALERFKELGLTPVVLTSPMVRIHFRKIVDQMMSDDITILSYNEVERKVKILSEGIVAF